ncbi:MAG TPA: right-handed parallel beta-helix repeat-containing protein [Candidatus Eisenbacteria bacterium]|nr:right-handed parallel beta-helix repeat-containing protein [Candidatus Eisenbacteria bacterium]
MFGLAVLASPAPAATLRVPADYPTVRTAADAAASGDTVQIAPGTYDGGVFINGKRLTFASDFIATGDTATVSQTVLNSVVGTVCNGAPGCAGNAVLEFGNNAHGSAVIGLTIRGGENGISSASTVDVDHCHVIHNGDGVDYVDGSGGTFSNSLFADNTDDGIDLNGRLAARVLDNVIRDNRDDGIEYRLYAYTGPVLALDVIGNRITGNREDGIQIIDYPGLSSKVIRIERNLFMANFDASGLSGAITCMPNGETIETLVGAPIPERIQVTNNTFIGEQNGVVGGANLIALNNVFSGITGTAVLLVGGGSITSYALFWNNGQNADLTSVVDPAHLVLADPALDANGRPAANSPVIDAGTASFTWLGQTVLDLPPAAYLGNAPDLGAFEVGGGSPPPPPPVNAPPFVSAGPDIAVTLPDPAMLDATVSDDGLPTPSVLTTLWTVESGPGAVVFGDAASVGTQALFDTQGTYVLRITASDGALSASDVLVVVVSAEPPPPPPTNTAPTVNAGPDRSVTLPDPVQLEGTVDDDGLPSPPSITISWVVESGPAGVTFDNAAAVDARATFSAPGIYVLRLTASDGALSASDLVEFAVAAPPNHAPVVDAGPDLSITLPAQAVLDAAVTDDGLPSPSNITVEWSVVTGPGAVVFDNPGEVDTRASFTVAGTYVLQLTASDDELAAADNVIVEVAPPLPSNEAPVVSAGPDQSITLPAAALLDGAVNDDGLPSPPSVTIAWSVASGPGPVTFDDATAADTRATFTVPGTYALQLTASDGELHGSDMVQITVFGAPGVLDRRIAAAGDDTEEEAGGNASANVTDLELVYNGGLQKVGVRFADVSVPAGSTVTRAWLQFEADETQNEPTALVLQGEAIDHAPTFLPVNGDVSRRARTAASTTWAPPAWTQVGEAGDAQRTPDLSAVLQEVIDRPGWASGNAVAFIITGTGHRTARSFEGRAAGAALLHVEYALAPPPPLNVAPVVDAGPDRFITLPAQAQLDGTVSDDGQPAPPALVTTWSVASGPGPVSFDDASAVDTRATFTTAGTYVLQLVASDGLLNSVDFVQIFVRTESGPVDRVIVAASDDVEEDAFGVMNLNSLDLELVFNTNDQTVGLRFTDLPIPRGAPIFNAYVQFEVDEEQTETTDLVIHGEAADNAGTFNGQSGNASGRPRTAASVAWSPAPWTGVGVAGAAQRTPDLSAVLEEIVARPGWARGNAAVLLISGTGHRTAMSFDGRADGAPRLHLEYGAPQNQPPLVDAGAHQDIMMPATADLDGTVGDDGLSAGPVSTSWSLVSGPAPVIFDDASAVDTRATFTEVGTYWLRLTANDGALTGEDSLRVRVHPGSGTIDLAIVASTDDVEEDASGVVNVNSLDLEMTLNDLDQKVGLRFTGVTVPPGARVTRAWVQFTADEAHFEPTSLVIQAQATDNAETFLPYNGDLSARALTEASVFWSPGDWEFVEESGDPQRTADLSPVLQEVVNRAGWESGNAVVFAISGSGHRTAVAWDANPAAAPRLHVEFGRSGPSLTRSARARTEEGVTTPRFEFALLGPTSQPARGGALGIAFSLPDAAPATIELVDIAGRRVATREVGSLGAGRHEVDLARGLSPGIYMVRLTRAGDARVVKAAVLR